MLAMRIWKQKLNRIKIITATKYIAYSGIGKDQDEDGKSHGAIK